MKDNERHPAPPPQGDPHRDDHGHKRKKKRRGGVIILFLVLIIIILVALIWFFRDGFGLGKGNDDQGGTSNQSSSSETNSSDFVSDVTEIRIEQNNIYFGTEKCENTDALKDKITAAGSGKKYKLEHKTAIEDTYNTVKNVLIELRDALNLEIDFNE